MQKYNIKTPIYNPKRVEKKWKEIWLKNGIYEPDLKRAKKPFYNLMMFPYPSAEGLHIGNMYAFVGSDIYSRFTRMKGKDVFEPIGLDGFGIHSENYALKIGSHPMKQAAISEKRFYNQLEMIGNGFARKERLETYDPEYYKWTQWIFVQMFKNGLAYRKKAEVNWCPSCKTVLADEQVLQKSQTNPKSQIPNPKQLQATSYKLQATKDGVCERCETTVIKKELEQWFFRITNYAERLLKDLDKINWSEKVKAAQRNWIGKSEGATIKFQITNPKSQTNSRFEIQDSKFIKVFTTRPDTIFGATFLVLNPEHQIIRNLEYRIQNLEEVNKYIKNFLSSKLQAPSSKSGIELKGVKAVNPANNEEIPIWVSDYVLAEYGTGAIMAVPAHDQRDFEFAKKFNLPLKMVICPNYPAPICPVLDAAYEKEGHLIVSGEFSGIKSEEAKITITKWLAEKGLAEKKITYRLRDWLISRQRYWGPPIPLIFCENCKKLVESSKLQAPSSKLKNKFNKGELENPGWAAVPEKGLPVKLPFIKNFKPLGKGESPLAGIEKFYKVRCPKCDGAARRETDVSDTFLDSSWYYYRYPSIHFPSSKFQFPNSKLEIPWNQEITRRWLPVARYMGGFEHSVLHLLYTRFITKVFYDWKLINFNEPFKIFRAHGHITKDGVKMSKSRGNVVNPDEYIKKFGADTLRMYLMFIGPHEQGGDFQDAGIRGITRFLEKVWRLGQKIYFKSSKFQIPSSKFQKLLHQSIKKITEDIENLHYNTAISQLMILLNELERENDYKLQATPIRNQRFLTGQASYKLFLRLLAPFAPYITEELWQQFFANHKTQIPPKESPYGDPAGQANHKQIQNSKFSRKAGSRSTGKIQNSIHLQEWPKHDPRKIKEETFKLIIQINGKIRDTLEAPRGISEEAAKIAALEREKVKNYISGKIPQKIIFVPNKLINIVV